MSATVKTKRNISLYAAKVYLQGLYSNAEDLLNDPEYARRFHALLDYVLEQSETLIDTDIIDEYIVIEQYAPTGKDVEQ